MKRFIGLAHASGYWPVARRASFLGLVWALT